MTGETVKSRLFEYRTLLAGLLLLLLIAQAVASASRKSVTVDEIMYIGAGYYHWKTGDFQLNMTNPPLMKLMSALPLLLTDATLPESIENPKQWSLVEQWQFARKFLYQNSISASYILTLARLPIILVSVLLGVYVYRWSYEVYGPQAALFSLFLYSFSPNILAHARLATHDLGLAVFMFITCYYFWKYLRYGESSSLLLCGICMGLSLLTKTTAGFLLPILGLYCLLRPVATRSWRIETDSEYPVAERVSAPYIVRRSLKNLAALTVSGIVAGVVLNAGYGFQGTLDPVPIKNPSVLGDKIPIDQKLLNIATKVPVPFPTPYLELIKFQRSLTMSSGNVFFAGTIYEEGLWYLMLVSFLIKTPIPMLMILCGSLYLMLRRLQLMDAEWLMITFVGIIFFVFSYLSNINVGLRYILPVYPFIHLMAGRFFKDVNLRRKWVGAATVVLCLWYLVASLSIHPHYLAYFNELVGGPKNGYKYLVDSNLDWGQDLKGLKRYMVEKGIDKIKLGYFGSADANYYGIDYDYLPSVGLQPKKPDQYWWYEIDEDHRYEPGPQKGWIAVSATLRASSGWMKPLFYDTYAWLREYEPIDQVGHSILIYYIE